MSQKLKRPNTSFFGSKTCREYAPAGSSELTVGDCAHYGQRTLQLAAIKMSILHLRQRVDCADGFLAESLQLRCCEYSGLVG